MRISTKIGTLVAESQRLQSLLWLLFLLIPTSRWLLDGNARIQYSTLLAYVLIGLLISFRYAQRGESLLLHPALLPLLLYLGWMILLFPLSPIATHAGETVLEIGVLFGVSIYCFAPIVADIRRSAITSALIALATLFSVANLVFVGLWLREWLALAQLGRGTPPFGYRLPGAFLGHANMEAGYLALILPLVVVRFWRARGLLSRSGWVALLGVFSLTAYFTSSRAGWAATAVGVLTSTLLLALSGRERGSWRSLISRARSILSRPLVVGGLLVIAPILLWLVWIQATQTSHAPLLQARAGVWNAGVSLLRQSPLVGHGPGSSHVLVVVADQLLTEAYFIHPHNLLLFLGSEGGIIGLGIVLVGVAAFLISCFRSWQLMDARERAWAAGPLGALTAAALHNQADLIFEAPVYSISVLLLVLLLLKPKSPPQARRLIHVPPLAMLALLIPYLMGSLFLLRGIGKMEEGVSLAAAGGPQAGAEQICAAAEQFPAYALGPIQCALALSSAVAGPDRSSDQSVALEYLQRGIESDPYWPAHWANLAALQWTIGSHRLAMEAMAEAVRRAPAEPRYLVTYGAMAESRGEGELAKDLYRRALQNNPGLTQSIFFSETELRKDVLGSTSGLRYRNELSRLSLLAWDAYLEGDYQSARRMFNSVLEGSPHSAIARSGLAATFQELGDEEQAWYEARNALLGNSQAPRVPLTAGRIALDHQLEPDAFRLLEHGWRLLKNRSESATYYGIVYRRVFLPNDLVPQVIDPRLTSDMVQSLNLLQELYEQQGEPTRAEDIRRYVEGTRGILGSAPDR